MWQSNEELRNTNGCYLVTQFSSSPTNRFILSELSFLAKVMKKTLLRTVCKIHRGVIGVYVLVWQVVTPWCDLVLYARVFLTGLRRRCYVLVKLVSWGGGRVL